MDAESERMRGRLEERIWVPKPGIYAPARYRKPCKYEVFIPGPLSSATVDLPGETAGIVSDAETAISVLNADAQPGLQPLARLLLRTEAIASSKVEGMQMDVRTLARAEARHDVGASVGPEAADILANIDAMQLAVDDATATDHLTPTKIVGIHRALMRRAAPSVGPGVLRDRQNWIGGNDYTPCGADFVPPPSEHVERLLDDLCQFSDQTTLPPLVQAAIAHAQFETIHPFNDGNGRTGRALVQVILRRRGLAPAYVPPISVILAADKDAYISGLERFRRGEVASWIDHFTAAAAQAALLAKRYLADVRALQDSWREALRAAPTPPRSDSAVWLLVDALPAHPIITQPVGVAATGRAKPRVNQAINHLVGAGVLVPLSQSNRNRSWEAVGLLDLIAGLENAR